MKMNTSRAPSEASMSVWAALARADRAFTDALIAQHGSKFSERRYTPRHDNEATAQARAAFTHAGEMCRASLERAA